METCCNQKHIIIAITTILLTLVAPYLFSDTSNSADNAKINIVKYPIEKGAGKVRADEFIKLFGLGATDANVPETRRKMFEIAQHKKTQIFLQSSINADLALKHDNQIRQLARAERDGFSIQWGIKMNFLRRVVALYGHIPKEIEKHNFYFVIDTNDDQIGDRVYKAFIHFKNKEKSNIKGYASKADGSAITPQEAKNAGL